MVRRGRALGGRRLLPTRSPITLEGSGCGLHTIVWLCLGSTPHDWWLWWRRSRDRCDSGGALALLAVGGEGLREQRCGTRWCYTPDSCPSQLDTTHEVLRETLHDLWREVVCVCYYGWEVRGVAPC